MADVEAYVGFGAHRTGSVGDLATSAWFADYWRGLGYEIEQMDVETPNADTTVARLTAGGATFDGFAQPPLAFTPATPPDRCFVYGGLFDRLAHPVEQASALARHWGDPHVLWFAGGHVSHSFNGRVSAFVDDALRSSL